MARCCRHSDWPLPPLRPSRTLPRNPFSNPIPHSLHPTIRIKKLGFLIVGFSNAYASSPVLEGSSNGVTIISVGAVGALPAPQCPATGLEISNKFIRGLCADRQTEPLAFACYMKARERPGFRPDTKTLNVLVLQLLKAKQWSSIADLMEDFEVLDVFPDGRTCARLVASCVKVRKFGLVDALLGILEAKKGATAVAAFSSAMHGYNKLHMYRSTVSVHDRMRKARLSLDADGYRAVMEAYRAMGDTDMVVSLFLGYKSEKWYSSATSAAICAIVCDALARSRKAFDALWCLREMEGEGISPSPSVYASVISSFADIREAEMAEKLYREAKGKAMAKDPAIFTKLVIMYVEIGLVEKTVAVIREMREMGMDVTDCIFSAVVNGFVKRRGLKSCLRAYQKLLSVGCEPGQVTYASIINVYCRLGLAEKAEGVFSEMIDKGFDRCIVAYSNMISMYGKIGRASDAMRLLAVMKQKGCDPNVWVYNSVLDMHGRLMEIRQVEKIWKEMKRRKIRPDRISYTAVISAYNRSGQLDRCINLYQEFKVNGGRVDRAMAGLIVGVLSKTSRFNELIRLLQELKLQNVELDTRLYVTALNSFRDAGLKVHEKWLASNFSFKEEKT